jgi:hypothetical protein
MALADSSASFTSCSARAHAAVMALLAIALGRAAALV